MVSWPYKVPSVPLPWHQQCPVLFDFSTGHTNSLKLFHLLYVLLLCARRKLLVTLELFCIIWNLTYVSAGNSETMANILRRKTVALESHTHNRIHLSTDAGKSSPILAEAPLKHLPLGYGRGCVLLSAAISSNWRCRKQLLHHIFGNTVASMNNWMEFTFPVLGILYSAFLPTQDLGQFFP